jgi:hypothetical protein
MARTELQLQKMATEVCEYLNAMEAELLELTGGYPAIVRKVDESIVIADVDGSGRPTLEVLWIEEAFWCVRYAKKVQDEFDLRSRAFANAREEFQGFYEDLNDNG